MVTKTNERELASKISEWINEIIKRNDFPFTSTFNGTYQIKISKDDKMIKQIIARYKQKLKERLRTKRPQKTARLASIRKNGKRNFG